MKHCKVMSAIVAGPSWPDDIRMWLNDILEHVGIELEPKIYD